MEEETSVALVPSRQNVYLTSPHRHSFHNLPNDLTLVINSAPQITESVSPSIESPTRQRNDAPRFAWNRNWEYGVFWQTISVVVSVLYCKLLTVLGFALPITRIMTTIIPSTFYEMFYVYLYSGSIVFMLSLQAISIKKKAIKKLSRDKKARIEDDSDKYISHGSFYLRLGACGFGIGSMVYSGLEFGGYFLQNQARCDNSVLSISKPALRMIFTLLQIHFIFFTDYVHKARCPSLMRVSLGHMLATNLAEWLAVVVEETKHEIHHFHPKVDSMDIHGRNISSEEFYCDGSSSNILVREATAYLFPCTIEYSLICAVTLVEMFKDIRLDKKEEEKPLKQLTPKRETAFQYTVDCTHTEKGLILGLICNVYTIISLIVFFSLRTTQEESAYFCLSLCESILNTLTLLAMAIAALQMRKLAYCVHRFDSNGSLNLGLDISLLLKAQIGTYVYSVFSAIACYFSPGASMLPDLFSILQTSLQTTFIIDTWWKRCATPKDQRKKPGRQCLTFMRSVNVAMWIITITEKNRAELKPVQLKFYGMWPWTIITHASMPLYVFYRFHSSICFFEIWRNSYKGIHAVPDSDVTF